MRPYVVAQESATAPAVPALQQSVLEQEKSPVMNAELPELIVDMSNAAGRTRFMKRLEMLQGRYVFKIEKWRKKRSNSQNRYYWSQVIACLMAVLEDAWGEAVSPDDAHMFAKTHFLGRTMKNKKTGRVTVLPGSTPKTSTVEFNEYIEKIAKLCASCGVIVPLPSEYSTSSV